MAQENHDKMNKLAKGNSCHYDHSQKATAHYELLKVVFNVQEELHKMNSIKKLYGQIFLFGQFTSVSHLIIM
jgi:hypothetical protein